MYQANFRGLNVCLMAQDVRNIFHPVETAQHEYRVNLQTRIIVLNSIQETCSQIRRALESQSTQSRDLVMRNARQIISQFYTAARDRRNIVERKIRALLDDTDFSVKRNES